MPGATGSNRPSALSRATASRFGVRAASSGVWPLCAGSGRSPNPSSTSRTILLVCSSARESITDISAPSVAPGSMARDRAPGGPPLEDARAEAAGAHRGVVLHRARDAGAVALHHEHAAQLARALDRAGVDQPALRAQLLGVLEVRADHLLDLGRRARVVLLAAAQQHPAEAHHGVRPRVRS